MLDEFKSDLDAIHIVGKGPSWGQAPDVFFREDPFAEVEIWGVNNMFQHHRNLDRSFLLHDPRQEVIFEDEDFMSAVREIKHPIYMNRPMPELGPMVKEFPAEWVRSQFPFDYYTNVVCWMLALAILLRPNEINCHGIDMLTPREYSNERGAVEHWIGVAVGRGIPITLPSISKCCTTTSKWGNVYGYIPKRKPNGLIYKLEPNYDGFGKPGILDKYVLLPKEEYEKLTGGNTSTGRVERDLQEESSEGGRQIAAGVER